MPACYWLSVILTQLLTSSNISSGNCMCTSVMSTSSPPCFPPPDAGVIKWVLLLPRIARPCALRANWAYKRYGQTSRAGSYNVSIRCCNIHFQKHSPAEYSTRIPFQSFGKDFTLIQNEEFCSGCGVPAGFELGNAGTTIRTIRAGWPG